MILQALYRYYQCLLARKEPGLSPFGYSPEKISYEILLASDGSVVDVNDIRVTSGKKPVPRILQVPQPEKRAAGVNSNFLWDKTSYVLGVSASSKRADKEHEAFKELHRQSLARESDIEFKALLAFLAQWSPEHFHAAPFTKEMLDTNVVFRIDGEQTYLHEKPAAKGVWARMLVDDSNATALATCLVTGDILPVARLHPAIKGVRDARQCAGVRASGVCLYDGSQLLTAARRTQSPTLANWGRDSRVLGRGY
jgi:CRISPR-associated protein Csd1